MSLARLSSPGVAGITSSADMASLSLAGDSRVVVARHLML